MEEGKTAQGMLKAEIASLKMDVDMDTRKLAEVSKTVHTLERDRNMEQEKRRRETERLAAESEKVDEADRSIKHLEQKINRWVGGPIGRMVAPSGVRWCRSMVVAALRRVCITGLGGGRPAHPCHAPDVRAGTGRRLSRPATSSTTWRRTVRSLGCSWPSRRQSWPWPRRRRS